MKYKMVQELTAAEEIGLRFNPKMDKFVVKNSPYKWLVTRDDDSTVLVGGLYYLTVTAKVPFIWFIPHESLCAKDIRGLRLLLDVLAKTNESLTAIIDETHAAAVRTATHLGFARQFEGVYTWHK
jgi:hypothetical protein